MEQNIQQFLQNSTFSFVSFNDENIDSFEAELKARNIPYMSTSVTGDDFTFFGENHAQYQKRYN